MKFFQTIVKHFQIRKNQTFLPPSPLFITNSNDSSAAADMKSLQHVESSSGGTTTILPVLVTTLQSNSTNNLSNATKTGE